MVVLSVAILAVVLVVSWLDQRVEAQLLRLRNSMLSTSLTDAQQEPTQAALHDPLTRLPNRLLLQRRIVQALAEAEQGGSRFAVMFMDLDGFKQVNDALRPPGRRCCWWRWPSAPASCPNDMLARLGGDEFAAGGTHRTRRGPAHLARRILQAVGSGRCCRTTNCR